MAPKDIPAAEHPYYISRTITLNRQDVIEALTAAVLAHANEISRFGPSSVRSMSVDAQVTDGHADIARVIAQVEAPLDPAMVAAMQAAPTTTPDR